MNILIIDDDSVMSDSICEMLDDMMENNLIPFSSVYCAHDFYQARQFLKEHSPYALIITDLLMPPRGLNIPNRPKGVMLNGWTFLYHCLLREDAEGESYHKDNLNAKYIIFSAYWENLKKYLSDRPDEQSYLSSIHPVKKGNIYNDKGGLTNLQREIRKLLNSK